MDLLFSAGVSELGDKKEYSGREVFSKLLPNDFSFELKTKDGNHIKIKKGVLASGYVNKKSIGTGSGLLIQKLLRDYGKGVATDFINRVTILFIKYLQLVGITIAPSDSDLPKDGVKKIKSILDYSKAKVGQLIEDFGKGRIEAYPGKTKRETLEFKILASLSKARNKTTHVVQEHLNADNGTVIIAKSGARGKLLNLSMVAACIGQMALRGQRIIKGYHLRALPHFDRDDLGAESHGFSRHGYKAGLNVYEFFFHSIAGRNSLMDTSMRTPKSGYLQRRLINSLQDIKVDNDGTVRDSNSNIIQFIYGEDGVDVSKTVGGEVK